MCVCVCSCILYVVGPKPERATSNGDFCKYEEQNVAPEPNKVIFHVKYLFFRVRCWFRIKLKESDESKLNTGSNPN